ncbi:cupin domain-containing protein [Salinisphaera sp. T31B1]|uniref:cupin domain-containing protein n=1 Tax=Salinisphaera sp. T31B1 TaxID=727963 RepID=UPI003341C764
MKIIHGRDAEAASENRTATFTGTVWGDPVMPSTDGVAINNVFFAPGARTHWHTHEHGQILQVTAGRGLICTDGGTPEEIRSGDIVWIPANERHWHGATPGSYMLHTATSLGETRWEQAVTDGQYQP